ncbi:putative quinol monooxygenase [Maritalea myrionectae]|uniref:putative quinol monooxygenase n=1 Tax=Maritalea myrionectae TaxID=454601 RepID=UPI0003F7305A|nr:antibiotic biosynthesis monooxygenase family protein [Maritalea myrionectae]
MMGQELIIVARLNVADKFVAELGGAIQDLASASRLEQGCIAYEVYRANDKTDGFLIYEVWGSDEEWCEHRSSPHMKKFKTVIQKWEVTVIVEKLLAID